MAMMMLLPQKVKAETEFHTAKATAYCLTGTTATGSQTKEGHTVASKPEWYGMTMIMWEDPGDHQVHPDNYIGTYVVEDTGSESIQKGWVVDVYIPNYEEAKRFGAKDIIFQLVEAEG